MIIEIVARIVISHLAVQVHRQTFHCIAVIVEVMQVSGQGVGGYGGSGGRPLHGIIVLGALEAGRRRGPKTSLESRLTR